MKHRTRIYIAGPYDGPDVITVLGNIRRGIEMASELMDCGMAPYCPFLDFQIAFTTVGSWMKKKDYQETSMAFVECCDAMLLLPGWEKSGGTAREIERARSLGIQIFDTPGKLKDWHDGQRPPVSTISPDRTARGWR